MPSTMGQSVAKADLPSVEHVVEIFDGVPAKDISKLIFKMGQRELQAKFNAVYNTVTRSNNNDWLRRKLLEAIGVKASSKVKSAPKKTHKEGAVRSGRVVRPAGPPMVSRSGSPLSTSVVHPVSTSWSQQYPATHLTNAADNFENIFAEAPPPLPRTQAPQVHASPYMHMPSTTSATTDSNSPSNGTYFGGLPGGAPRFACDPRPPPHPSHFYAVAPPSTALPGAYSAPHMQPWHGPQGYGGHGAHNMCAPPPAATQQFHFLAPQYMEPPSPPEAAVAAAAVVPPPPPPHTQRVQACCFPSGVPDRFGTPPHVAPPQPAAAAPCGAAEVSPVTRGGFGGKVGAGGAHADRSPFASSNDCHSRRALDTDTAQTRTCAPTFCGERPRRSDSESDLLFTDKAQLMPEALLVDDDASPATNAAAASVAAPFRLRESDGCEGGLLDEAIDGLIEAAISGAGEDMMQGALQSMARVGYSMVQWSQSLEPSARLAAQ